MRKPQLVSAITEAVRIPEARVLINAEEVKQGKLPPWMRIRLKDYRIAERALFPGSNSDFESSVANLLRQGEGRWLDHWGSCKTGPFRCCHEQVNFVSEPYDFGAGQAKALDHFCEMLGGLTWHVSSDTWWNPGYTLRITIHP